MHDKKFGFKVLAGIFLGALLGTALLMSSPVGVQPGDVLNAELASGEVIEVKVSAASGDPSGKKPVVPEVTKDESGAGVEFRTPIKLLGAQLSAAPELLRESSGVSFSSVTVKERGAVTIRPAITEAVNVGGQIFLRLLKMLVVPLIIATVLIGIASLGNIKKLGRLGGMTAAWYLMSMAVAVIVGITLVNLIKPGVGLNFPGADGAIADKTVTDLILKTIPENPIAAIATMDVVGILFFVIVMALAMLKLGKRRVAPVFNFFEGLNDIVYVLVGWVMKLAPIGVGLLIAHTIATQDVAFISVLLQSLLKFALCVTLGLAIQFVILVIVVAVVGKYNPFEFISKMGPAFATAFGTNSSSATMPVTLQCVTDMKVSRRIGNFVVPVGATVNMDGTALFEAVAVLFFAQAFGVNADFGMQLIIGVTAVVAAIGAAGIPSAGLVTMTLVLSAVGLPTTQMQLLWSIDRPLDMMRTVVNITGDAAVARVVQTLNPDIKPEEDEMYELYEEVEPEASRDAPA